MATRGQILIPIAITAAIIGIVGVLTIPAESKLAEVKFPMGTVKIGDVTLDVQIAETDAQRARGLMFQDSLPYDQGMIFVMDSEQVIPIWMLNMHGGQRRRQAGKIRSGGYGGFCQQVQHNVKLQIENNIYLISVPWIVF